MIASVLADFVVPIMYVQKMDAGTAVRRFWRGLLARHFSSFVLFYLCKLGLAILGGLAAVLVVVSTCCLAAIPYLSSVILLPLSVFFRSYSLFFLAQFGPEWDALRAAAEPPPEPAGPKEGIEPSERPT